jgi:Amidohydrolase family
VQPHASFRRLRTWRSISTTLTPVRGLPVSSEYNYRSRQSGVIREFAVMRDVRDAENARTQSEFSLSARRVLELGTIEGARSLGIDDKVGSLKPGKRADIIMVTTRALNMDGFIDLAHLLVGSALPENVDTVVVDGRILRQGGKLTTLSAAQVVAGARAALEAVRARTNGGKRARAAPHMPLVAKLSDA